MVKFYSQNHTYDHPFATVTLAYFLRYPNPYSRHVISTDVLDRHFDPATGQLSTTRLLLKRSRLPAAIVKLLPRGLLGANGNGDSQSYILERSVVDIKSGWMRTESRNLELRTVLDVIERQTYLRSSFPSTTNETSQQTQSSFLDSIASSKSRTQETQAQSQKTEVQTIITLHSRLGQRLRQHHQKPSTPDLPSVPVEEPPTRTNFLLSWSQARLQRSIEAIGLSRAHKSQPNAMEGMKVVLERLREGGLVAVLEGMRRDVEGGGMTMKGLLAGGRS